MPISVLIILIVVSSVYVFMRGKKFGAAPKGARLKKIQLSENYRNGQFQNISNTPQLTEGATIPGLMWEFMFRKSRYRIPPAKLPTAKADLLQLDPKKNVLVWFGHSSYFIQVEGKKILVDPVFSGAASPLRFTTKSFAGSDVYEVKDFPDIDYLFLTHDHWDHLDFQTVVQLRPKVKKIITGLGVGAHLQAWGYHDTMIEETDWDKELLMADGFVVNTVSARHFSGRGFKRNGTIWSSFVLTTPVRRIFMGGDSGYDAHFEKAGREFGPFDLVILEDGQYNKSWKYIHMSPEETVQAAIDLRAKKLLPVHWGKFALSVHAWDEPIIRIKKEAAKRSMPLVHPRIGQLTDLDKDEVFDCWWEEIR